LKLPYDFGVTNATADKQTAQTPPNAFP